MWRRLTFVQQQVRAKSERLWLAKKFTREVDLYRSLLTLDTLYRRGESHIYLGSITHPSADEEPKAHQWAVGAWTGLVQDSSGGTSSTGSVQQPS